MEKVWNKEEKEQKTEIPNRSPTLKDQNIFRKRMKIFHKKKKKHQRDGIDAFQGKRKPDTDYRNIPDPSEVLQKSYKETKFSCAQLSVAWRVRLSAGNTNGTRRTW